MLPSLSLRTRFIVTLALTFLVLLGVLVYVFYQLMIPGLLREERQYAQLHISHIQDALDHQVTTLGDMTRQWAGWDSTRAFMIGNRPDFPSRIITREVFNTDALTLLLLTDATDGVRWVAGIDPLSGRFASCAHVTGDCAWTAPMVRQIQRSLPHTTLSGTLKNNRLMAIPDFAISSTWPITRDNGTGSGVGQLTLVRQLPELWPLGRIDGKSVMLTLRAIHDPAFRPERSRRNDYIDRLDDNWLLLSLSRMAAPAGYRLLIQTRLPRDHFRAGVSGFHHLLLGVFGLLIATLAIALWLFHSLVLKPVTSLSRYAKRLRSHSNRLEAPPPWLQARRDELGVMAREFQHLITDLDERNAHLEALTELDALTGLGNRRLLDRRLPQILSLTHRLERPVALVMIDVDHFKAFNDYYGHPAGDECLKLLGATLDDIFQRESDLVVRIGGEEFVIILPDFDVEAASTIARGVRTAIEAQCIEHARSPTSRYVTISAGVAVSRPERPLTAAALIKEADQALYSVKHTGRNSVGYSSDVNACFQATLNIFKDE